MGPGGPPGLQNRVSGGMPVRGGFDSHALPPAPRRPVTGFSGFSTRNSPRMTSIVVARRPFRSDFLAERGHPRPQETRKDGLRIPISLAWIILIGTFGTAALLRQFHDRTPESPMISPVVGSALFAAIFLLLLVSAREWRKGAVAGPGVRLGSLTPILLFLLIEKWVSLTLYPRILERLRLRSDPGLSRRRLDVRTDGAQDLASRATRALAGGGLRGADRDRGQLRTAGIAEPVARGWALATAAAGQFVAAVGRGRANRPGLCRGAVLPRAVDERGGAGHAPSGSAQSSRASLGRAREHVAAVRIRASASRAAVGVSGRRGATRYVSWFL